MEKARPGACINSSWATDSRVSFVRIDTLSASLRTERSSASYKIYDGSMCKGQIAPWLTEQEQYYYA